MAPRCQAGSIGIMALNKVDSQNAFEDLHRQRLPQPISIYPVSMAQGHSVAALLTYQWPGYVMNPAHLRCCEAKQWPLLLPLSRASFAKGQMIRCGSDATLSKPVICKPGAQCAGRRPHFSKAVDGPPNPLSSLSCCRVSITLQLSNAFCSKDAQAQQSISNCCGTQPPFLPPDLFRSPSSPLLSTEDCHNLRLRIRVDELHALNDG